MKMSTIEVQNFQVTQMPTVSGDARKKPLTAEIQAWIVSYIAELLEVDLDEIDVTIPFDRYGLDSLAAVGMSGDLEVWLECELDATLLYDYPTIEALAQHLAE